MKPLYVDDCISILELVDHCFCGLGDLQVLVTDDAGKALRLVEDGAVDLVACEYDLRPFGGLSLFQAVRDLIPNMPFVFVTSYPPPQRLIELLRSEWNVRVVYKSRPRSSFLPALRSAFVAAHEEKLKP